MTEALEERSRRAERVTLLGTALNLVLAALKLVAGILGSSSAMVADAVHSVSDFGTDIVVILTMRITRTPQDRGHQYGHGKFETLASVVVGGALAAVGVGLLVSSARTIVAFAGGAEIPMPGSIALAAAAVSILVKELLYRVTRRVGRRISSNALTANAWHHRSDALSSVGALLGIGGARLLGAGFRVLDPIAGVVISGIICWAAVRILRDSVNELLEGSVDEEVQDRVLVTASSVPGVTDPHRLRIRRVGSYMVLDLHIRVPADRSVAEGHALCHAVEDRIASELGPQTIVTIHTEPGCVDQGR